MTKTSYSVTMQISAFIVPFGTVLATGLQVNPLTAQVIVTTVILALVAGFKGLSSLATNLPQG